MWLRLYTLLADRVLCIWLIVSNVQVYLGYSSVVEHNLAEVEVEGSNPFTRYNTPLSQHASH